MSGSRSASHDREPAIEVWKKIQAGADELSAAEELGFTIEYFRNLLAQEFIYKLNTGASFDNFPELTSELEDVCWTAVAAKVKFGIPESLESPLCIQLRLKLLSFYRNGTLTLDAVKKFLIRYRSN